MSPLSPSRQILGDVLTTAIEGGVNYWAAVSEIERLDDLTVVSVLVHETDDEDGGYLVPQGPGGIYGEAAYKTDGVLVDLAAIRRALDAIVAEPKLKGTPFAALCQRLRFGDDDADYDASDAEVIVQYAVLGEQVYG